MLEECTAAVLVGVMRLDSSPGSWAALSIVPGAWSVSCAGWQSFGLIVRVSCLFFSSAVPGVWSFLLATLTVVLDCFAVCLLPFTLL